MRPIRSFGGLFWSGVVLLAFAGCGGETEEQEQRRPQAPDPPDDSCGRFGIEFDGGDCSEPCPVPNCGCDLSFYSGFCNMGLGCPIALDCDAACDPEHAGEVLMCSGSYQPCTSDDDCAPWHCVTQPGENDGECNDPVWQRCREDADCRNGGICVAENDGRRVCSGGLGGEPCNADDQCLVGRCVGPLTSVAGNCSAGEVDEPCESDATCLSGFCLEQEGSYAICTSGESGASCLADADCRSGHCALFPGDFDDVGSCTDGQENESCSSDEQCASNICDRDDACSSGGIDAVCDDDDDCVDTRCSASDVVGYGRCTDGADGSPCSYDTDCSSMRCDNMVDGGWGYCAAP